MVAIIFNHGSTQLIIIFLGKTFQQPFLICITQHKNTQDETKSIMCNFQYTLLYTGSVQPTWSVLLVQPLVQPAHLVCPIGPPTGLLSPLGLSYWTNQPTWSVLWVHPLVQPTHLVCPIGPPTGLLSPLGLSYGSTHWVHLIGLPTRSVHCVRSLHCSTDWVHLLSSLWCLHLSASFTLIHCEKTS